MVARICLVIFRPIRYGIIFSMEEYNELCAYTDWWIGPILQKIGRSRAVSRWETWFFSVDLLELLQYYLQLGLVNVRVWQSQTSSIDSSGLRAIQLQTRSIAHFLLLHFGWFGRLVIAHCLCHLFDWQAQGSQILLFGFHLLRVEPIDFLHYLDFFFLQILELLLLLLLLLLSISNSLCLL